MTTGLAAVAVISLLVAAGFGIRWRRAVLEGRRRQERLTGLEVRIAEQESPADAGREDEWRAVLAHELRSSVGAILGYSELLSEGAFGALDERASAAARRIGYAADQLLGFIHAIDPDESHGDGFLVTTVPAGLLLEEAAEPLRFDAEARGVTIIIDGGATRFVTRRAAAARVVRNALGAAIKASADATLRVTATDRNPEPQHHHPTGRTSTRYATMPGPPGSTGTPLTGAGLRLASRPTRRREPSSRRPCRLQSARRTSTRMQVTLPPLPIDGAEQRP
jgi:signal transduction histidine kinase